MSMRRETARGMPPSGLTSPPCALYSLQARPWAAHLRQSQALLALACCLLGGEKRTENAQGSRHSGNRKYRLTAATDHSFHGEVQAKCGQEVSCAKLVVVPLTGKGPPKTQHRTWNRTRGEWKEEGRDGQVGR